MLQPDLVDDLLATRKRVVAQQDALQKVLSHLDQAIKLYEDAFDPQQASEIVLLPPPVKTKRPRVRGVLAAARKAIEEMSGPFDKNQLLEKLQREAGFSDKKITRNNIRNALRLLTQDGVIKVESEATAKSCAKYVRAA
jgi:uncharacterized damage-inducible protein DinB